MIQIIAIPEEVIPSLDAEINKGIVVYNKITKSFIGIIVKNDSIDKPTGLRSIDDNLIVDVSLTALIQSNPGLIFYQLEDL